MSQVDGQTQAKKEDKRGALVLTVLAVGALTAYPPLYVMLRGGLRGMLNGIAGDTYHASSSTYPTRATGSPPSAKTKRWPRSPISAPPSR